MADALARRTEKPAASPVGSMTQADWFAFLEKYTEADERVKKATNARKDLRKKIEEKLGDADLIEAFDRARKNRDVSGAIRAKLDAAYAQLMAFDRKPLFYQSALGLGEDGKPLPMTEADAARVDFEGLEAGRSKHNRTDNPYTPGEEEFARWDTAWLRGQAMIGASLTDDKDKKAATLAVVEGGKGAPAPGDRPRRGRPPGSGKKAAEEGQRQEPTPPPDQGEGGDTAEGPGADPNEGERSPEPQNVEGSDGGPLPDRYGSDWPSAGGNGNGTTTH